MDMSNERNVWQSDMLTPIQDDRDALWKQRYRIPVTYGLQIAAADSTRGLALSNRSGVEQLYVCHVQTGELAQLTNRPEGTGNTGDSIPNAILSPDSNYVYYFNVVKGNETGHFVRVPFTGGSPEDITPGLLPYMGFSLNMSSTGNRCGFTHLRDGI